LIQVPETVIVFVIIGFIYLHKTLVENSNDNKTGVAKLEKASYAALQFTLLH